MSEGVQPGHPRYESLRVRELLVAGVDQGVTSRHGLIAHGRGEALDYLLGERTHRFAETAIRAAAALMLRASRPVISVNGNAAALVPSQLVELSKAVPAALEVNLFHAGSERETLIADHLRAHGAEVVLLPDGVTAIEGIASSRRLVNASGIGSADVVFVPLEDGDRCAALRAAGKLVIAVDLNPLSRTSKSATVAIIDNVVRALPRLVSDVGGLRSADEATLISAIEDYDNLQSLRDAEAELRRMHRND